MHKKVCFLGTESQHFSSLEEGNAYWKAKVPSKSTWGRGVIPKAERFYYITRMDAKRKHLRRRYGLWNGWMQSFLGRAAAPLSGSRRAGHVLSFMSNVKKERAIRYVVKIQPSVLVIST